MRKLTTLGHSLVVHQLPTIQGMDHAAILAESDPGPFCENRLAEGSHVPQLDGSELPFLINLLPELGVSNVK